LQRGRRRSTDRLGRVRQRRGAPLHWQTICIQAVAACQSFAELLVGNFYRIRAAV